MKHIRKFDLFKINEEVTFQRDAAMEFHGRYKTIDEFIMNGNSYLSHLKK